MQNLMLTLVMAGVVSVEGLPALPWTDRGRIQGEWEVVSCEDHGTPTDQLNGARYFFDGEKFAIRSAYFDLESKPYHLNTGKEPREIDIVLGPGRIVRGIYRLNGDELKLCTGNFQGGTDQQGHLVAQTGQRPTAFDSRQGSLVILKRRTPNDARRTPNH